MDLNVPHSNNNATSHSVNSNISENSYGANSDKGTSILNLTSQFQVVQKSQTYTIEYKKNILL